MISYHKQPRWLALLLYFITLSIFGMAAQLPRSNRISHTGMNMSPGGKLEAEKDLCATLQSPVSRN